MEHALQLGCGAQATLIFDDKKMEFVSLSVKNPTKRRFIFQLITPKDWISESTEELTAKSISLPPTVKVPVTTRQITEGKRAESVMIEGLSWIAYMGD